MPRWVETTYMYNDLRMSEAGHERRPKLCPFSALWQSRELVDGLIFSLSFEPAPKRLRCSNDN
jgi:hypothetical protein